MQWDSGIIICKFQSHPKKKVFMTLNDALKLVWNGNTVAFLGSGFSRGALNSRNEKFKTADEFRIHLNTAASGPSDGNLGDAAESYRSTFGDSAIISELTAEFKAASVADFHQTIARIPWRRVYTTNYDNVFEVAASKAGVRVLPITLKVDPFAARSDGLQLVHLNGSVEGMVDTDLDSILKLTDTSYVTSSISDSPWATTFRNDLRLADAVFFLGYSLFDLDVKRMVYESPELHPKSFFVLGSKPSNLTKQRIEKYGTLVEASVEDVAAKIPASGSPGLANPPFHFSSLQELNPSSSNDRPRDQDVFDLFEFGAFKREFVHQSISENGRYYLQRPACKQALAYLECGAPAIVLTASLGNGKTLALEAIGYHAVEKGYKVFVAANHEAQAAIEFEHIAKMENPTLIIVDDYASWMKELRSHALCRTPNAKLVLSARDTAHDVLYEKLETDIGVSSVPEINIDKLTDPEIKAIVDVLDVYGLWGDFAGQSPIEKAKFVKNSLSSEMHGILLRLLKSSDIGQRLKALVHGPNGRTPYSDIIASVFILASLKTGNPKIDMLADIWGADAISSSTFRNDPAIRNLLDFNRWVIRARSSVVAEYFLQEILGQDVVPVLIKVIRALAAGARGALVGYRMAFEELLRFATLQHILPIKGRLTSAIRFYEGVKDLPQAANHPLFWFQFGIACLAESDVSRAKKYFSTAYSLSEKKGFDTFQIDNHYARLLLVECSQTQMPATEAMDNFRKARNIINRQLQKERLAYPFRVARSYQDFIDRIGIKLDLNQLKEVRQAVDFVEERLEMTDKYLRNNRYVRDCTHAMIYVKKRCDELAARTDVAE
jgi:hypothetical protein